MSAIREASLGYRPVARLAVSVGAWRPPAAITLVAALVAFATAGSIGLLSGIGRESVALQTAPMRAGLDGLPLTARAAVAATLGRGNRAYWVDGFRAGNPAQRMSMRFSSAGVSLTSGSGTLGLSLVGFGRSGAVSPVLPVNPTVSANRVVYARGALREWYVNSPLGLEQGFNVTRAPAGDAGSLVFVVSLRGDMRARLSGGAVELSGSDASLRYGNLAAVDASGRRLPVSIATHGGRIVLSIDARGARYPVTVDPLIAPSRLSPHVSGSCSSASRPICQQLAELTAQGGVANAVFGYSIAVSGNTLVVGASGQTVGSNTTQGAVYVYQEPASGWSTTSTPTAVLTASDGASGDQLGTAVAIDGNTIVASANGKTVNGHDAQGAVYVFTKPPRGWATTSTYAAELTASAGLADDNLGSYGALAISGDTVVAGSYNSTGPHGAAYLWVEPGSGWATTSSPNATLTVPSGYTGFGGSQIAISNNTIVVGSTGASASGGAAYVYVEPGKGWATTSTPTATLTASDASASDGFNDFGQSVAISGNTIAVGSPGSQSIFVDAVYVYVEPAGGWHNATETAKLKTDEGGYNGDLGGTSVAISGDTIATGATSEITLPSVNVTGAVWVFDEPASGWADTSSPNYELVAGDGGNQDSLGTSVAISGSTVFGGAPSHKVGSNQQQGAAYVWTPSSSGSGSGGSGGNGGGGGAGGGGTTGSASVGNVTVTGTSAGASVSCRGASAAICAVRLAMSVTETLKGSKVIAVSARAKTSKKAVTVGTASVTLKGGKSELVQVALNAAGKRLLSQHHRLSVKLVVTSGSSKLLTKTITFVAHRQKR